MKASLASFLCTATYLACVSLPAQTTAVVPAGFDYESSGGTLGFLGLAGPFGIRAMQVIRAPGLGFNNRTITEIAFRHSSFWRQSYASTQNVRVSFGYTQTVPGQLPTQFAQIPAGPMTQVFAGNVAFPAALNSPHPTAWSIVIPLQMPWLFDASRGNFVMEIECAYVSGDRRNWNADVHGRHPNGAGSQVLSEGCLGGGLSSQLSTHATIAPGGNLSFSLESSRLQNRFGFSYIGIRAPGFPFDLTPFGATGCAFESSPILQQPASIMGNLHHSIGRDQWIIPPLQGLVGLAFDHQVVLNDNARPGGISLSDAHRVFIGSNTGNPIPLTDTLRADLGQTTGSVPAEPAGWVIRIATL